jgi:hypothetical protein
VLGLKWCVVPSCPEAPRFAAALPVLIGAEDAVTVRVLACGPHAATVGAWVPWTPLEAVTPTLSPGGSSRDRRVVCNCGRSTFNHERICDVCMAGFAWGTLSAHYEHRLTPFEENLARVRRLPTVKLVWR